MEKYFIGKKVDIDKTFDAMKGLEMQDVEADGELKPQGESMFVIMLKKAEKNGFKGQMTIINEDGKYLLIDLEKMGPTLMKLATTYPTKYEGSYLQRQRKKKKMDEACCKGEESRSNERIQEKLED